MVYGNPDEIVENIKTLDEAKELIRYLLNSQQMIYTVLIYECRTPLLLIKGYADMAQREDFTQEHPYFLKIISENAQRTQRLIEALWDDARFGWYLHQNSLLENFPLEVVDPNPILAKSIIQIQANIDAANELNVLRNELEKKKGQVKSDPASVNFHANVNENLPIVQFSSAMLEAILSDATWLLSGPYRDKIFITTDSDEQWVRVRFGYSTNSSLEKVLEDFQQFENTQTSREFYGESLFLYNTWRKLRTYGAELSLNIQEKAETSKSSRLEITIHLKR